MNRRQVSAVLCGTIFTSFCSIANAQSKVVLYGVIDEGLMYESNIGGGKKIALDSFSGINSSRWGLSGSEDLGGGLNAVFTLESGVNINNGAFGQGGTAFGRQTFVGLSSSRLGSVTFGRQYDMLVYFGQRFSIAGIGSINFGHPGDLDNTSNSLRTNNSIRYNSPDFHGLTFGAEYGVGGVAGDTTANSGYSFGAAYTAGAISFGGAFSYFKNPTSASPGSGLFTNNVNGASILSGSLNRGYASASAYQVAIVGATYTLGPVTFSTSYSNTQYANLGPSLSGGTARFNNADFGVKYTYSPTLWFGGAYEYLNGRSVTTAAGQVVGNQHYNQISLLSDYLLSKRTDVYLSAGFQKASGVSSTGAPAVANMLLLGDSSNDRVVVVRAALRHKF
jgi:predicted porin